MKVQRYLYGGSNVQQLEQRRSRLRSPQEVAQEAYAPYGAVEQAAGTISDDLFKAQAKKNKLIDDEDELKKRMYLSSAKDQVSALKKNVMADDTLTADDYTAGVSEIFKGLTDKSETISERNRGTYSTTVDLWSEGLSEILLMEENDIRQDKMTGAGINAFNQAVQNNDLPTAHAVHDALSRANVVNDDVDIKMQASLEKLKRSEKVNDVVEEAIAVYNSPAGRDGVDKMREDYLKNPDPDPETSKNIVSGLNTVIGNIDAAEKSRIDLKESIISMEVVDIIQDMGDPSKPQISPDVWVQEKYKDTDISPKFLAGMYQKMVIAQSAAKKDNESFNKFRADADAGFIMYGNTANRKNADKLVVVRADEAQKLAEEKGEEFGDAQKREILINTTQELGFTGEMVKNQFKGGLASPRGVASMGPLFHDLTSDMALRIDLGLEDGEYQKYSAIEFDAMSAGGTPDDWYQAAETYNQQKNDASKDKSYAAYVADLWDEEIVKAGSKGYQPVENAWQSMWSSEPYDAWNRIGVDQPDVASPEYYDYLRYYEDGYKNGTGDHDKRNQQAKIYATKRFTEKNPPTNLNGEWQHDRDGIEGEANYKRIEWFNANKDKEWFFVKDGKYTSGTLDDLDKLKFMKPDRDPVRTADQEDVIEYDVFYEGGELIPFREGMDSEGLQYEQSRTVQFGQKDQAEIKSRMENDLTIKAFEEDIQEWKQELRGEKDMTQAMTLRKAIEQREKEIDKMRNPE